MTASAMIMCPMIPTSAYAQAQHIVQNYGSVPEDFIHEMLLIDFSDPRPGEYSNTENSEKFPVSPFQFLECHDKSRRMYFISGEHSSYEGGFDLFNRDTSRWYRLHPFAVILMTGEGIWQGQEFGEIYGKHDYGDSWVLAARRICTDGWVGCDITTRHSAAADPIITMNIPTWKKDWSPFFVSRNIKRIHRPWC